MQIKTAIACGVICLILTGCWNSPKEVKGSVFIVTQGGESVKLGLVKVVVVDSSDIFRIIDPKREAARKKIDSLSPALGVAREEFLKAKLQELEAEQMHSKSLNERQKIYDSVNAIFKNKMEIYSDKLTGISPLSWSSHYLDSLPKLIDSTKTDADGKFSFMLKPGKYAFIATASRKVGDSNEDYDWCVIVDVNSNTKEIFLSNDNMYSNPQLNLAKLLTDLFMQALDQH